MFILDNLMVNFVKSLFSDSYKLFITLTAIMFVVQAICPEKAKK